MPEEARRTGDAERILGAVAALFGGFFMLQALQMSIFEVGRPGPGLFPLSSATLMAVAGLWLMFSVGRAGADRADTPRLPLRAVTIVLGVFACYVVLIPIAGYALSTFGFVLAILRTFPGYGWRRSLLAAAAVAVGYVLVFEYLLGMPLPRNPLDLP